MVQVVIKKKKKKPQCGQEAIQRPSRTTKVLKAGAGMDKRISNTARKCPAANVKRNGLTKARHGRNSVYNMPLATCVDYVLEEKKSASFQILTRE